MPRSRKKPAASQGRKRERDYGAEYQRRQERARELGFKNYYEERTRGVPGIRPPADLDKYRGHRGTSDFKRFIRAGDVVTCAVQAALQSWDPRRRRFREIEKTVYTTPRLTKSGRPYKRPRAGERTFVLRNLTRAQLRALIRFEVRVGVVMGPTASLDQKTLLA